MRIFILTVGTGGDVQPYVALGSDYKALDTTLFLLQPSNLDHLITKYGLTHAPLQANFTQLLEIPAGPAERARPNPLRLMRQLRQLQRQFLDESWAAARDADALVYHPKAMVGYRIAEKLNVPGFLSHPLPLLSPTRYFSNPALPVANLGSTLNYASYTLFLKLAIASYRSLVNAWRREVLNLPPMVDDMKRNGQPVRKLYAYSARIVPTPPDWVP